MANDTASPPPDTAEVPETAAAVEESGEDAPRASERTVTFEDPKVSSEPEPRRSTRPEGLQHQERIDLVTGRMVTRTQSITEIDHLPPPRSKWQKMFPCFGTKTTTGEENLTPSGRYDDRKVFRVRSTAADANRRENWVNDGWMASYTTEGLRWTFRATFTEVVLVAYILFLALIVFFALFVFWIGRVQPYCVQVLGTDFITAGTDFMDA